MPLINFCSCGCTASSFPAPSGAPNGGKPLLTIDVHAHVTDLAVDEMVADHPTRAVERAETARSLGAESAAHNGRWLAPRVQEPLTSVDRRLADMEEMGVQKQLLSPAPSQYHYWADEDLAGRLVEQQNATLAGLSRRFPDRFAALGNVALQHPKLAAWQLRRAVLEHGLLGAEISSSVQGRELSDPQLDAFWAMADSLECIVFIHPLGTSAWQRLDSGYLTNSIGQPLETTIALSRLIASGLLDRYPRIRILAAHGGGFLPAYFGRVDHAYCVRPEARTSEHRPSDYLRKMWFDSVVYSPMLLRHLIDVVGSDRIVIGSDYPYDMGMYGVHHFLDNVPGISPEEREAICHANALRLLSPPEPTSGQAELAKAIR